MIGKQKNITTLLFLLSFIYSLSGLDISLQLSDMEGAAIKNVEQGVPFLINVTVHGGEQDLGEPIIEHLKKLDVAERYPTTTNISIINGVQTIQRRYVYKGRFDHVGQFVLGPAYYEVGNNLIQSNAVAGKVVPCAEQSAAAQDGIEDPFMHITINKNQAYIGEQLLMTVRLCFKKSVLHFALDQFSLSQFAARQIDKPEQDDFEYAGRSWKAIVYRFALYPQESGSLVIPSLSARGERERAEGQQSFFSHFRSFFGPEVEKFTLVSKPLSLFIKSLPSSSKEIAGVGTFNNFSAHIDKKKVEQSKGITYTMTLTGTGDLATLPLELRHLPKNIRAYESKSSITAHEDHFGQFTIQKEWVLQLLQPGKVTIPAQELSFFDPVKEEYRLLRTNSLSIQVVPGVAGLRSDRPSIEDFIDRAQENAVFVWPILPQYPVALFLMIVLMVMLGSYLFSLYRPVIEKIVTYRRFSRRIRQAYVQANAQLIYDGWIELFIERLHQSQREKELVVLGENILEEDLHLKWRLYVRMLEQNSFEYNKQKNAHLIYEETTFWMQLVRGRL